MAAHQFERHCAGAQPGALRGDCLSLVHWRAARSFGSARGSFFCNRLFWQWYFVPRHVVRRGAVVGAILIAFATHPEEVVNSATFHVARATAYNLVNIYMIKMAGVFMITASTLAISTAFAPRWLAIAGYILAVLLLIGSYYISWSFVVFPVWVFLISFYILRDNLRPSSQARWVNMPKETLKCVARSCSGPSRTGDQTSRPPKHSVSILHRKGARAQSACNST